jgi:Na+-transporting methylmalonyl-CoA/oxaloacetate decarboxylase gamma subunit
MNPTLVSALWITLIGMGLVFVALLLLWGLMALLVNATSRMAEREAAAVEEDAAEEELPDASATRRKAAAAAVAVAMAAAGTSGAQPMAQASQNTTERPGTWQAVMRSNRLNQHSRTYTRKQ